MWKSRALGLDLWKFENIEHSWKFETEASKQSSCGSCGVGGAS